MVIEFFIFLVKVVKGGIECEACEIVVKYVDSYLKENKTEVRTGNTLVLGCQITSPLIICYSYFQ